MPQDSRANDWCFTLNNPLPKHVDKVWDMDYKYLVWQIEVGESGTPHIQGFVQFHDKQRLTALKKLISNKVHWEKRRGTPYEASHYCKKPVDGCECEHCDGLERFDHVNEDGNISAQSQVRVHEVAEVIKTQGLEKAIERFPDIYMGMSRGMQALETFYCPKRDFQTEVTVLYGISGAGKTRYAMEAFPSPYKLACFGQGTDFFGDYRPRQHETVVADEFYSNWQFNTWKQVCDRYPTEVHTKGGFLQFLASHMVFTSNSSPDQWYPNVRLDSIANDAFNRRVHNIVQFTAVGVYVVRKGHLPFPALPWMSQMNVNQALMNPQNIPVQQYPQGQVPAVLPFPRSEQDRRAAWLRANRQERQ